MSGTDKKYNNYALQPEPDSGQKGQIGQTLGPNGSGKTTLMCGD